jgi:hypothetical protein
MISNLFGALVSGLQTHVAEQHTAMYIAGALAQVVPPFTCAHDRFTLFDLLLIGPTNK